jgi:transcriptional regulator with PAS, ATPase and Fis domain
VRKGLCESAAGGTLFLDEIGDLNAQSQIKLLRLLQEREYRPLGSDMATRCTARIITATCKSLDDLNNGEHFRKDLFYRLGTHHIDIPPLRSRKDDIELLVNRFIGKAALELGKRAPAVPRELITLLQTYHFPGNVRELQAMVFDAVSVCTAHTLSLGSFEMKMGISGINHGKPPAVSSEDSEQKKVIFSEELPTLREIEELLVSEALRRSQGNQSIASRLLGITRQALGHRLKKAKE